MSLPEQLQSLRDKWSRLAAEVQAGADAEEAARRLALMSERDGAGMLWRIQPDGAFTRCAPGGVPVVCDPSVFAPAVPGRGTGAVLAAAGELAGSRRPGPVGAVVGRARQLVGAGRRGRRSHDSDEPRRSRLPQMLAGRGRTVVVAAAAVAVVVVALGTRQAPVVSGDPSPLASPSAAPAGGAVPAVKLERKAAAALAGGGRAAVDQFGPVSQSPAPASHLWGAAALAGLDELGLSLDPAGDLTADGDGASGSWVLRDAEGTEVGRVRVTWVREANGWRLAQWPQIDRPA